MARTAATPTTLFSWPTLGWEYMSVALPYDGTWDTALNELGLEGWQVISIVHDEDPEVADAEARVTMMRPRAPHPAASNVKKRDGKKNLEDALRDVDEKLAEIDEENGNG